MKVRPAPTTIPNHIERSLREEIPAQAPGPVVERVGRALQIVGPGEPDQAIAQILALEQKEDDEDGDEPRSGKRIDQGLQHPLDRLHRGGFRRPDLHRDRRTGIVGCRALRRGGVLAPDLLIEVLEERRDAVERATGGRGAQRAYLLLDVVLIGRKLLRQQRHLLPDQPTDAGDHEESKADDDHHRGRAGQSPAAQQTHDRSKQERQQDRQRDRQKDRLGEIQRGDDAENREHGEGARNPCLAANAARPESFGPENAGHLTPVGIARPSINGSP